MRPHRLMAAVGLLSFTLAARADIAGNTIDAQYIFPTQTTVLTDLGTFAVPGSTNSFGQTEVTVTGTTISFTDIEGTAVTFTPDPFNGYKFIDLTGPTGITGITLVGSPTGGFSSSDASFDPNDVFFNFESNVFSTGETVTYDLQFASTTPIPEPTSLVLLATSFLGFAGASRWRSTR